MKLAFSREFTAGYFNNEKSIVDASHSSKRGILLGVVRNGVLQLEHDLRIHDGIGVVSHGKANGDFVKKIIKDGKEAAFAKKGECVKLFAQGFSYGAKIYLMTKHEGKDVLHTSKKFPLHLRIFIKKDNEVYAVFKVKGKELRFSFGVIANEAKEHPLKKENIETELKKYDSGMFFISQVEIETDNSFVPISKLTAFRKKIDSFVLDNLFPIEAENKQIELPVFEKKQAREKKLHVRVYNLNDVEAAVKAGADVIYYDAFFDDVKEAVNIAKRFGKKIYLHTPMVMLDGDIEKFKKIYAEVQPDGMMVNNVGLLNLGLDTEIVLGYQMNVFNDLQLEHYKFNAIASLELNLQELKCFAAKDKLLYYAHGYPVVMTFKEDFVQKELTDEMGYSFALRKNANGATEMLYSKSIGLLQHTQKVLDAGILQLYLDLENDAGDLVLLYRRLLDGKGASEGV